jgi:hypothetical protein
LNALERRDLEKELEYSTGQYIYDNFEEEMNWQEYCDRVNATLSRKGLTVHLLSVE